MGVSKLAPTKKRCAECGQVKPLKEFRPRLAGLSGTLSSHWGSYCQPCNVERQKESYYRQHGTADLAALAAKTARNLSQIRAELARRKEKTT